MLTEDGYTGDIRDPLSLNLYTYCGNDPINRIDPSGNNWTDAVAGWAKSVDDSIFFGAAGKLANKIRSLFGAEENDWEYAKSNNPDFALTYQAGTYANLIYGFVNMGSGIYKTTTSAGEALVTSSGEIVRVNSGTVNGIIQTAQGAGISLASSGNIYVWSWNRSGSFLPDVFFRKVNDNIEIAWDNKETHRESMIEYINPYGICYVPQKEFQAVMYNFLTHIIDELLCRLPNETKLIEMKTALSA